MLCRGLPCKVSNDKGVQSIMQLVFTAVADVLVGVAWGLTIIRGHFGASPEEGVFYVGVYTGVPSFAEIATKGYRSIPVTQELNRWYHNYDRRER